MTLLFNDLTFSKLFTKSGRNFAFKIKNIFLSSADEYAYGSPELPPVPPPPPSAQQQYTIMRFNSREPYQPQQQQQIPYPGQQQSVPFHQLVDSPSLNERKNGSGEAEERIAPPFQRIVTPSTPPEPTLINTLIQVRKTHHTGPIDATSDGTRESPSLDSNISFIPCFI